MLSVAFATCMQDCWCQLLSVSTGNKNGHNTNYLHSCPHFSTVNLSAMSSWFVVIWYSGTRNAVFCPGFQKGRVPSEKGTFSAVNGPSKGHNSPVN